MAFGWWPDERLGENRAAGGFRVLQRQRRTSLYRRPTSYFYIYYNQGKISGLASAAVYMAVNDGGWRKRPCW